MLSPDTGHDRILAQKPLLAFDETRDFAAQQTALRTKLLECLGEMPEKTALHPVVEYTKDKGTFTERRIRFQVEKGVDAVCLFCIPNTGKKQYPLFICMQGHGTGMHISMGYEIYDDDKDDGDRNYGMQALERGYAVLCLEQRGMGERRTEKVWKKDDNGRPRCDITAHTALLLGRTMVGERCHDVSCAIDLALTYPQIDKNRIACTGNSGGGTTTFYAACVDERIAVAMPSCSVCTYRDSIAAMPHCSCNFIPGIARYADMGDLAACIAPRKLIILNGIKDIIFPEKGVNEAFATVEKIYAAAGVPDHCAHATGNGGHRYYKQEMWEAFDRIVGW